MHQISIQDAQASLPALLKDVMRGEEIILTDAQLPVAKISRLTTRAHPQRRPGTLKGLLTIAEDFDAPLEEFKDYM